MNYETTHFTSDWHIFHNGVMKWERERFANLDEMHHEFIHQYNLAVKPTDIVYNLGDLTFEKTKSGFGVTVEILRQLNGYCVHLKGNHDHKALIDKLEYALLAAGVNNHTFFRTPYEEIKITTPATPFTKRVTQKIVMCHYPIADHRNAAHGNWMLHGHEHGGFTLPGKVLDVGLDAVYKQFGFFRPIRADEVRDFMETKQIKYYGHHRPRAEGE